jgi:ABC-type lipopolysaccharide export system ATPase subunit
MASKPTEIEKQNLEAHVELCAVRYGSLETKLNNLEQRMDKLELHLIDIKNSLSDKISGGDKQTISIFTTMMGVILAGLLGFISHSLFK